MLSKNNKKTLVSELKEDFRRQLEEIGKKLDHRDKMQVAINARTTLYSINRYTSGDITEIRKLELAESILSTAKEVLRLKESASSQAV